MKKKLNQVRNFPLIQQLHNILGPFFLSNEYLCFHYQSHDGDEDFNEMLRFFRGAGLGCTEAKLCAADAVVRGAKTAKKFAVMVKAKRLSLEEMFASAGTGGAELDEVDYELVALALSHVIQSLYTSQSIEGSSPTAFRTLLPEEVSTNETESGAENK